MRNVFSTHLYHGNSDYVFNYNLADETIRTIKQSEYTSRDNFRDIAATSQTTSEITSPTRHSLSLIQD